MRLPFGWALPAIAGAATVVGIAADSNRTLAIPAGAVAVAAAGAALWIAVRRWGTRTVRAPTETTVVETTADWFDEGIMGQEAIVLMLDRIERQLIRPDLPSRSTEEIGRLRLLPPQEFFDYVDRRLTELEGGS